MTAGDPTDLTAHAPEGTGDTGPGFFDPERYSWPPDPVRVQLFVLAVLAVGGPLTWWAVSR